MCGLAFGLASFAYSLLRELLAREGGGRLELSYNLAPPAFGWRQPWARRRRAVPLLESIVSRPFDHSRPFHAEGNRKRMRGSVETNRVASSGGAVAARQLHLNGHAAIA